MTAMPLLTQLATEYASAKDARGVLDFADQVAGALEIIEAAPVVAQHLREQFRVVLLDEYQDTSVIQTQLLSTIFHDHPVMAVGDPFQSIYGWRGASADNLDAFAASFARTTPVANYSLMISWRNDTAILRAAKVWAAADGRTFVLPDDVKALAQPAWHHRIVLDPEAEFRGITGESIVDRVLAAVIAPQARQAVA